jgi:hypothetical protein
MSKDFISSPGGAFCGREFFSERQVARKQPLTFLQYFDRVILWALVGSYLALSLAAELGIYSGS